MAILLPLRIRWGVLAYAMSKAKQGEVKPGHKWTRRVPKPGGGFYYYYSDASLAHTAKEGETISLRERGWLNVQRVDGDHLTVVDNTGMEGTISFRDLHDHLREVYRERFAEGANRIAKRFVAQASKVTLKDLADPAKTHAALAERFRAAKVSPEHAKRLVGYLSQAQGWSDDAKRTLLAMASSVEVGPHVAAAGRQIARAAENLRDVDGDKAVKPTHVGQAAALRLPKKGDGTDTFDDKVIELRQSARVELARMKVALGAIEAAGDSPAAKSQLVEYAHVAMKSDALAELERMAEAFPSLRDAEEVAEVKVLRAKWQATLAEHAGASKPDAHGGFAGAETTVYVADAEGRPSPQTARYRLVEANAAIASHDPGRHFQPRPEYPEGVQERMYHRDRGEQDKVRTNAREMRPDYLVNTNPDAVNGPPIVTSEGVTLGGNSRVMSVQLAYQEHPDAAKKYRAFLKRNAASFGLTTAQVDALEAPMLVREVDVADKGKANLGLLVRKYNETFTQGMDPRADQVARGRLVSESMLDTLANAMNQVGPKGDPKHKTLNAYLSSSEGREFVQSLQSAAEGKSIIDRRNRSQYVGKDGKLNEDGKTFVERVLVGKVIADPELLSNMLPSQVSAVAQAMPHIVRAGRSGHDVGEPLRRALEASVYMRGRNLVSASEFDRDQEVWHGHADLEAEYGAKPKLDAAARHLLDVVLDRPGPVQMSAYFREFAEHARRNPAGQSDMFGPAKSTADVLGDAQRLADKNGPVEDAAPAEQKADAGAKATSQPEQKAPDASSSQDRTAAEGGTEGQASGAAIPATPQAPSVPADAWAKVVQGYRALGASHARSADALEREGPDGMLKRLEAGKLDAGTGQLMARTFQKVTGKHPADWFAEHGKGPKAGGAGGTPVRRIAPLRLTTNRMAA